MAQAECQSLVSVISAAIAAHDPLDPWMVVSNYDEHYWDDIAQQAWPRVATATSERDVFVALADVLKPLVVLSDEDRYAGDRIAASAAAVWRWLCGDTSVAGD